MSGHRMRYKCFRCSPHCVLKVTQAELGPPTGCTYPSMKTEPNWFLIGTGSEFATPCKALQKRRRRLERYGAQD